MWKKESERDNVQCEMSIFNFDTLYAYGYNIVFVYIVCTVSGLFLRYTQLSIVVGFELSVV